MVYEIMFKERSLCTYDDGNGAVLAGGERLPFGLYLEKSDEFDDRVNNKFNFTSWCSDRIIPMDRKYAREILNFYGFSRKNSIEERAKIGIATRCLSLTDGFWVRKQGEDASWNQVNLFDNSLKDAVLEVALTGKSMTLSERGGVTPDLGTAGLAPKAWVRRDDGFQLLKGDVENSVRREVEASKILLEMGFDAVGYEEGTFAGGKVSECPCFTAKGRNYVTATDFSIWLMNHDGSLAEFGEKYSRGICLMNLADYLVGNDDRHGENWGFIYDDDFDVTGFAPIFDFDHAFLAKGDEPCKPLFLMGRELGLGDAAREAFGLFGGELNLDVDFGGYAYGEMVGNRLAKLRSS